MSLFILTLGEAKAELEITDTVNDTLLTSHMEQLQGRFEDSLNRKLCRVENVSEFLDGGAKFLLLSRRPVERVSSVTIDSEAVSTELYTVNQDRGRVTYRPLSDESWPCVPITVVYTGGYVAAGSTAGSGQTPMPEGLRGLFRLQLAYEWRNRRTLGQQSVSAQGVSVSLAPADWIPIVKQNMTFYARI